MDDQIGYNVSNTYDDYDAIVDHYLNRPEIVKMDEQRPINDPTCEHVYALDPTDRIGNSVAWMCVKDKCGRGAFYPEGYDPNTKNFS